MRTNPKTRRFLLAPWMFSGHTDVFLELARALVAAGAEVHFYAETKALAQAKAIGCVPRRMPLGAAKREFLAAQSTNKVSRVLAEQSKLVGPHLLALLEKERFDLVLTEALHLGAGLAARASGQRWVSLSVSPFEYSPEFANNGAHAKVSHNRLRAAMGLEPTEMNTHAQGVSPQLHLLSWFEEFDYGPVPKSAIHVGPLLWNARNDSPKWLRDAGDDKRFVLISRSTLEFVGLRPWLRDYTDIAIEAAKRLRTPTIITGVKNAQSHRVAKWIRLERFVPHGPLMPKLSAIVAQGGIGTIFRALKAGIPMVLIPYVVDNPANSAHCEKLGVARTIPGYDLTVERLCDALEGVLSERSPERTRAKQIARTWSKRRSADAAVTALFRFIDAS